MACQCSEKPADFSVSPELIALYRLREKHALFNLHFWRAEYALRGDRFAKECWLESERLYCILQRIVSRLQNPKTLICPEPSIEQK